MVVGKTTMPDFGMPSSGHRQWRDARNPWQLSRNWGLQPRRCHACAAGLRALHRHRYWRVYPVAGEFLRHLRLKPHWGAYRSIRLYMGRVAGPMTRTVLDAAMLMNVIARPIQPIATFHESAAAFGRTTWRSLKVLAQRQADRCSGRHESRPACEQRRCWVAGLGRCSSSNGARVEPIQPFINRDMLDGICGFFEARSHLDIMRLPESARAVKFFRLLSCIGDLAGTTIFRRYRCPFMLR